MELDELNKIQLELILACIKDDYDVVKDIF